MTTITVQQAQRIYISAGGPNEYYPAEWENIRREMEAVINAKSDRAAGRTIDWWGCWTPRDTATAFARKVREAWAKEQSL